MTTRESLRQQATELASEVKAKSALFEKGDITPAEFSQYMDNAETQNSEISQSLKNYERAMQFRGVGDEVSESPEVAVKAAGHPALDRTRATFANLKEAATPATRRRGEFSFEFGLKSFRDEAQLKTQGVTGMMGDATSGTTAPSALSGYFLGGTAGPFITPEFIPGVLQLQFYENVVASLFPSMPVSSPVVSYVREATWTNNSAAVNEGATKPTSTNSLTRYTEQVGKIANLARVTDELIQDAAYVWSLIQQRLVQGVQRKEEVELLAGSGYPGCNGLLNRSSGFCAAISGGGTPTTVSNLVIPASGTSGAGAGSDTVTSVSPTRAVKGTGTTGTAPTGVQIALGVLNSITDIRVKQLFEPDAVLLNPMDWVTVRTSTDSSGQFFGGSFFGADYGYPGNQPTSGATIETSLWGKKTVTTPVLPAGLILVGDFADAGAVLRLGGLRVDITNTNGTDFEQNLFTARAEERVGLLVERPELFSLIQLQNA